MQRAVTVGYPEALKRLQILEAQKVEKIWPNPHISWSARVIMAQWVLVFEDCPSNLCSKFMSKAIRLLLYGVTVGRLNEDHQKAWTDSVVITLSILGSESAPVWLSV